MRFKKIGLILALLTVVGCASLPAKQKAVQSTQAVDFGLTTFRQAEWRLCNEDAYQAHVAAGRTVETAVKVCTGPNAAAAQLTTEKHVAINLQIAEAQKLQQKVVTLLQGWQQGQPAPADLGDLMTRTQSFLDLVRSLATTDQQKQLVGLGVTVLSEVQKIIDAIRGGR